MDLRILMAHDLNGTDAENLSATGPRLNSMTPPESSATKVDRDAWWTRDHALVVVLVVATAILLFLCWRMLLPFVGPLAWALALAVIAHPMHRLVERRIKSGSCAAGVSVFLITLGIIAPAIFVGQSILNETSAGLQMIQSASQSGSWREGVAKSPWLQKAVEIVEQRLHAGAELQGLAQEVGTRVGRVLAGSAWAIVQLLLTLFVLFYLFRDRRQALTSLRALVPLSETEADEVFRRVSNTIRATVFGTVVVALVQGALGGLMFWRLGLPAPILWGVVMALLAIIPVLGAFVVWLPAAIFLAATGDWQKALILTVWGGVVIALVDNLLYPILVGSKLRLHTVPVFFAILGGLALFGAAGIVLGPVILALTDAILEIWRRRTSFGKPAEIPAAAA